MSFIDGKLRCDGHRCDDRFDENAGPGRGCPNDVTHIEEKGWVYCASFAAIRKGERHVRKLQPFERRILQQGKPLKRYKPLPASAYKA